MKKDNIIREKTYSFALFVENPYGIHSKFKSKKQKTTISQTKTNAYK
jgi:hypothetical protein